MTPSPRVLLQELFDVALKAADPDFVLEQYLPADRSGKLIVVGAGKGAAKMARALERSWQGDVSGIVITRYGHAIACDFIEVIEASHPVPDEAGKIGAERILDLVSGLDENDQVICLISGGGSALLSLPAAGISMGQKQALNKALLHSGASIEEMNCVRKHLSAIKGGRLAEAVFPAKLLSLAISDVPGDDPSVIASGPTVVDETTCEQALNILKRYNVQIDENISDALKSGQMETVKKLNSKNEFHLIATPQLSLQAAADYLEKQGIACMILSDRIEGEAREIAKMHSAIVRQIQDHHQPIAPPCILLSGGETTVTIKGKNGKGGPNAEFLLSFLEQVRDLKGVYAFAADTDGIDGSEDNAGAFVDPTSHGRAKMQGLKPSHYLEENQSYDFFKKLDDLFIPGPTLTNVNDIRAIYIKEK